MSLNHIVKGGFADQQPIALECKSIQIVNGAAAGDILTASDSSGNAVWSAPAPAGLQGLAAQFVQYTQSPNNSVASGLAFELLTDNPTGVYNTIPGLTTASAPTQGTAILLPIGNYIVDYETSMSSVGPIAISLSPTNATYTVYIPSKSGSTTATTWVHGRSILSITGADKYMIVGPTDSVAAVVVTSGGAPQYIVRLTILQI